MFLQIVSFRCDGNCRIYSSSNDLQIVLILYLFSKKLTVDVCVPCISNILKCSCLTLTRLMPQIQSNLILCIDGTLVAPSSNYYAIGNAQVWIKLYQVNHVTISGGTLDAQGAPLWFASPLERLIVLKELQYEYYTTT
ncbi:hypothetical protein L6452_07948 [Arctium lappa]|uniref:Uncharacterized protein n=1 Tax=Arctium lappa TaxID=4217 RepID=A0ACB9DGR2_ARCLA|nr:hypothetical protein L6452_07948 [Arctium lappa]